MRIKGVIFDLDGTLLDTLQDLATAVNHALTQMGFPVHPLEAFRRFIGDGSRQLVTRALPPHARTAETVTECLQTYRRYYDRHWHDQTRPYPGITVLLHTLQAMDLSLAVLTNKPHDLAVQCIAYFFPATPFHTVIGQREGCPIKPDPQAALTAARQLQVGPASCLLLGDSGVDMAAARAAGMGPIGALWGFRARAELEQAGARTCLQAPQELLAWLD
jgi:phosphoglycolate phosphatase